VQQHRRLLSACHVAFLPSAAEMYGIAPIESAAFRRPAVVSDAVEHVAAEPARYAAYARAARSRYEHSLNWDAWGRRVHEVIEQVI
jgi:hypothetical protein